MRCKMGSNDGAKSKVLRVLNKYSLEDVKYGINYFYLVKNDVIKQTLYECFNENKKASFSISCIDTPYDDMILRQVYTEKKKINMGIIMMGNFDFEEIVLCDTQIECTNKYTIINLCKIKEFNKTESNHILSDLGVTYKNFYKKSNLLNLNKHIQPWRSDRLTKVDRAFKEKYKIVCRQLFEFEAKAYTQFCEIIPNKYAEPRSHINSMNSSLLFEHLLLSKADCTDFKSPEEYFNAWSYGLYEYYGLKSTTFEKLLKCYQNEDVRKYMKLLFEKNYYEYIYARERYKVPENLRKIFIFDNYNLLAILVNRSNIKAEHGVEIYPITIPKVPYNYFTIKHLLTTGVYEIKDVDNWIHIPISDYKEFYIRTKNISNSNYEKAFIDCYIRYVEEQKYKEEVPLLIPEFRYDGISEKHSYRLDFLILNFYTNKRIGIEISPSSTHINAKDYKTQWERENDKRNDFLSRYGISLITFTDSELKDIDSCFDKVIPYLSTIGENEDDISIEERLLSIKIEN